MDTDGPKSGNVKAGRNFMKRAFINAEALWSAVAERKRRHRFWYARGVNKLPEAVARSKAAWASAFAKAMAGQAFVASRRTPYGAGLAQTRGKRNATWSAAAKRTDDDAFARAMSDRYCTTV